MQKTFDRRRSKILFRQDKCLFKDQQDAVGLSLGQQICEKKNKYGSHFSENQTHNRNIEHIKLVLPFTLHCTSESSTHDLNDSDTHNLSLNLDDRILRVLSFATATNFPFTLHSTITPKKANKTRVKHKSYKCPDILLHAKGFSMGTLKNSVRVNNH